MMSEVAVVTGGNRGIGEAICGALKNEGYKVAANYGGNEEAAKRFSDATGIPASAHVPRTSVPGGLTRGVEGYASNQEIS